MSPRRKIGFTGIALLIFLAAAPAMAQQSSCLVIRQIYGFKVVDKQTLLVENISHNVFKVSLYGPCTNIDLDLGLGFKSFSTSDLDCLRRGDEVVHHTVGMGSICPIKSVEPYTAAMQQADQAEAAAAKADKQ
ncbi:MAG: DUF6491 family protein [Rhizomicrobium sp.]|jgi:hypothetical protein